MNITKHDGEDLLKDEESIWKVCQLEAKLLIQEKRY